MGVSSTSSGRPGPSSAALPSAKSTKITRLLLAPAGRTTLDQRLDRIEAREAGITTTVESIHAGNSCRDREVGLFFVVAKLDETRVDLTQEVEMAKSDVVENRKATEFVSNIALEAYSIATRASDNTRALEVELGELRSAFSLERQKHAYELQRLTETAVRQEMKTSQVENNTHPDGSAARGKDEDRYAAARSRDLRYRSPPLHPKISQRRSMDDLQISRTTLSPISPTWKRGSNAPQAPPAAAPTGCLGRRRSCNDLPQSTLPVVPSSRQLRHPPSPPVDRQHISLIVRTVVAPYTETLLSLLPTSLASFPLKQLSVLVAHELE
ncbi:hypothetical protein MD484_g8780, partial [Candolleomyces efflorescens]